MISSSLTKKLRGLGHGHSYKLILASALASLSGLSSSTCEHLQRLHRCCSTHCARAGLLATAASTIHLLVLSDCFIFIDVTALMMSALSALQRRDSVLEHALVARVPGVLLSVVHSPRQIVAGASVSTASTIAGTGGVAVVALAAVTA